MRRCSSRCSSAQSLECSTAHRSTLRRSHSAVTGKFAAKHAHAAHTPDTLRATVGCQIACPIINVGGGPTADRGRAKSCWPSSPKAFGPPPSTSGAPLTYLLSALPLLTFGSPPTDIIAHPAVAVLRAFSAWGSIRGPSRRRRSSAGSSSACIAAESTPTDGSAPAPQRSPPARSPGQSKTEALRRCACEASHTTGRTAQCSYDHNNI